MRRGSLARMLRKALTLILPLALAAMPAHAQDDEDLAPLMPVPKTKTKTKAKPRPRPKPKPKMVEEDIAPLVPSGSGELIVKIVGDVQGARLLVDGRELGTLPMAAIPAAPGDHLVEVRRAGYAPFSKKVTIGAGKPTEVSAALAARSAVLTVRADVSGAQVLLNGKLAGSVPLEEFEATPGPLTVTVKKEGYEVWTQTLSTKAGKDYPLSAQLVPTGPAAVASSTSDRPVETSLTPDSPSSSLMSTSATVEEPTPVYKRWYFWAGLAVVAGAVAAGTAIGVSSANAPAKPLTANEICGGPCDACINCSAALKF